MGAAGHGLRALRLVLLGGALAVLWMVLSAVDATAAPGQGDRSVVAEAPVLGDVVGVVLDQSPREPAPAEAPEAVGAREAAEAAESAAENRKTVARRPVRSVATTVERVVSAPVADAVPELVTVVDTTVQAAEEVGSDVVEVAVSTTDALPVAPVVSPVLDPVVDVVGGVVDEVTPPIGAVIAPTPPAGDPVPGAPPAPSTGAGDATEERVVTATSPDVSAHGAEVVHVAVAAATGMDPAAAAGPWPTAVQQQGARVATTQHTAHASDRSSSLPTVPAPTAPTPSGCVPGATSGGGGQLDQAADRVATLVHGPAGAPSCPTGSVSSVPGPSALPGFSPE